jgi:hypothetical protein
MAQPPSKLTIFSIVIAVVLLADDIRLRTQLERIEVQSSTSSMELSRTNSHTPHTQAESLPPSAKRVARKMRSEQATAGAPEEAVEKRIENEVEARLGDAVEAAEERIENNLDAIVEDRVEERIEEHHEQRRERHQEAMQEHIAEFIAEGDHTPETEARMVGVLDQAMANVGDLFRSVHSGEIERETARAEVREIRSDVEASLVEILGQEEAEQFQEDLHGPLGSHGSRR